MMEKNYKENEISENESQFQEKREVNKLSKNKKIVPDFFRINFEKSILFVFLMFISPVLLALLNNAFSSTPNVKMTSMEIFYWLPGVLLIFYGIFGLVFYLFILYFFACLIINAIYADKITRNNIRKKLIYSVAFIIGVIIIFHIVADLL